MKVVLPNNDFKKAGKSELLPLTPKESTILTKENSAGLQLAVNPSDVDNSPKFKKQVLILTGSEDVRTVLTWCRDVKQAWQGLNITTGPEQARMAQTLTAGTAQTTFETKLTTLCTEKRKERSEASSATSAAAKRTILESALDDANNRTAEAVLNTLKQLVKQLLPRRILA